jgi:rod shape-determining protein MreD
MRRGFIQPGWLVALSLLLAAAFGLVPLPDWLAMARPALLPLVTLYWALVMPRRFTLAAGWSLGLLMDVINDTVLGEHALALVLACFVVAKFSDFIRSYRYWQQALLVFPVLLGYEFLLFWLDGLTGHNADPLWRWAPALTSAFCWPPLCYLFRRLLHYTQGA